MRDYLTFKQKLFEAASFLILVIAIICAAVMMSGTNGQIPIHYDIHGVPDRYGSPVTMVIFPIIMLLVNGILSVCLHFLPPSAWNFPFKVKPDRAPIVYMDACWMMLILMMIFAAYTLFFTLTSQMEDFNGLWGAVVLLVTVGLDIVFMMIKSWRDNM